MHGLTLRYDDGLLRASCECGCWEREWDLAREDDPLAAVDGVDEEYRRHAEGEDD